MLFRSTDAPIDLFATIHNLSPAFSGFPGYHPAPKTIAAHPILADMVALAHPPVGIAPRTPTTTPKPPASSAPVTSWLDDARARLAADKLDGWLLADWQGENPVAVDVVNETDVPEYVHWHGLFVPSEVDGAEEEGTPSVPPHGRRRYQFVARPAGSRWYHSHTEAMLDLHRDRKSVV